MPALCLVGLILVIVPAYALGMAYFASDPKTIDVGYSPKQPVPFSHKHHITDVGIDCRYCHTSVEDSPFAGIPPTSTCMNCHTQVHGSNHPSGVYLGR